MPPLGILGGNKICGEHHPHTPKIILNYLNKLKVVNSRIFIQQIPKSCSAGSLL